MPQSRQLAAIMFTDIEGYTAFMQKDEQTAVGIRNHHRKIFEKTTEKFNGKILQYYGDGTLSIFDSAIDAVNCGIELQLQYLEDPRIPVRIGIHLGDIMYSDIDIVGDGVNLASRIESLAEPGSVLISEKVQDEIKNQRDLNTQFIGSFHLKNITDPVAIYAVSNHGLKVPKSRSIERKAKKVSGPRTLRTGVIGVLIILLVLFGVFHDRFTPENNEAEFIKSSIAVLPFANMSGDSSQQYFSDGITEDIITHLTKISNLKVISRSSSYRFRDSELSLAEIGKLLDVNYILEGSVRKSGDEIRIGAQLINVVSDAHLWAETYDEKMSLDNIFNIQTDVATRISISLKGELLPHEQEIINQRPTENLQAYDAYLKGNYYLGRYTVDDTRKAMQFFEKAIALDSNFFGGYSGLGNSYALAATSGYGWMKPKDAIPLAKTNAIKALEINGNSGSARSLLGDILYWFEYNWREAEVEYKLSIQLDPEHIGSKLSYALLLSTKKRPEEALALINECIAMDPVSARIRANAAWRFIEMHRFDQAIEQADIALKIEPNMADAHIAKAWGYFYTDQIEKAHDIMSKWGPWPHKGYLEAYLGYTEQALAYLDSLHQLADTEYVPPVSFAMIYTGLNHTEKALQWFDRAYQDKSRDLIFLDVFPVYERLKEEKEFQELLKKVGQ